MAFRTRSSKRYSIPPIDTDAVERLRDGIGLSRPMAELLVLRGITDVAAAQAFLNPDLARDWHDPLVIPGMAQAAQVVEDAIRNDEHILIFGDFDVDGISATTVLTRTLRILGATVTPLIPLRLEEGYGLSRPAAERIIGYNPDLVITVDNGIAAAEEVAFLKGSGISVVVTDHHEPGDLVPVGVPVCDPKLVPDCPSRDLAGVGVALKLSQVLGQRFGKPDIWRDFTDLAALGTVADQMSLLGENRALVADGITKMNVDPSPAISAFRAMNPKMGAITADGLSFSLLPRINSAGRMGDATMALDLLLADDLPQASAAMAKLEECNNARRTTEAEFTESAMAMVEETYHGEKALVLGREGWHEGIKGIVAARLVNSYDVPTILFSIVDGVARGSGRTAGTVNLFKAVEECSDLLTRFGGHEAAVGVTLPADRLDEFRDRLCAVLSRLPEEQFQPEANLDMEVSLEEMDLSLLDDLDRLAPFGQDNRVPIFMVTSVFMEDRRALGTPPAHFSCSLSDGVASVRGIWFHAPDLGELMDCDRTVDAVFQLERNQFRGKVTPQAMIRDIISTDPTSSDGTDAHTTPIAVENTDGASSGDVASYVDDLFSRSDTCLDRGDYAGITDVASFHTKVAGVTFEGRQDVLARLTASSKVSLLREPQNTYDPSAIAVMSAEGKIGYLNARLSSALAPAMDAGTGYEALLTEVTGGGEGRSLGANLLVCRQDAANDEQLKMQMLRENRQRWTQVPRSEFLDQARAALIGQGSLHEAQARSLALLDAGRNVLTVMATGRGKSLIFQLHAACRAVRDHQASVFIYPLRALVSDQAYHLQETFMRFGIEVRVLTGESPDDERDAVFSGIGEGTVDIVLTTPEFLSLHADRFAASGRVRFLVVDEAHHIGTSKAGSRPAYSALAEARRALGDPVTLAVTATAADDVASAIVESLSIDDVILDDTVRENLELVDERDARDRETYLAHIVAEGGKSVIYVNSRDQSVKLARMLRHRVPKRAGRVAFYNAGLSRGDRTHIEGAFRDGAIDVVISTSAFGEGVNIPDIRNVVLYHLPFTSVEFNQMAGRAGRDGDTANIFLLFGSRDASVNEKILQSYAPPRDDMVALYRTLVALQKTAELDGENDFTCTNANIAELCVKENPRCGISEEGVSCGVNVFRELGFLTTRGYGTARRIGMIRGAGKVELSRSARYLEGCEQIEEFDGFRQWVLSATADELLARFNRPILPNGIPAIRV